MKEENNAPKNKWSQIFRKKWFFPAVYLTIAALLLSAVVWYQNTGNETPDAQESEMTDDYNPSEFDEDAEAVLDQQEDIQMPVEDQDQTEIVTKFYDYSADQDEQEAGLVLYNNRYYQSTGVDIVAEDDEPFDVVASLSGTVSEVKEDPLLGNVVVVSHEDDVATYYASLEDIDVKADTTVKQGDTIGTAGKNLFGKDSGTHLHFELRKDGQEVNPETFFNQPFSKLEGVDVEEEKAENKEESNEEEVSKDEEDAEQAEEDEVDADTEQEDEDELSDDMETDPKQEELDEEDEDLDQELEEDEQQEPTENEEEQDEDDEQTNESSSSQPSA